MWFIVVALVGTAYAVFALFVLKTYSRAIGLLLFAPLVVAGAILNARMSPQERTALAAASRAGSSPAPQGVWRYVRLVVGTLAILFVLAMIARSLWRGL
jgi:hypothetical protein